MVTLTEEFVTSMLLKLDSSSGPVIQSVIQCTSEEIIYQQQPNRFQTSIIIFYYQTGNSKLVQVITI